MQTLAYLHPAQTSSIDSITNLMEWWVHCTLGAADEGLGITDSGSHAQLLTSCDRGSLILVPPDHEGLRLNQLHMSKQWKALSNKSPRKPKAQSGHRESESTVRAALRFQPRIWSEGGELSAESTVQRGHFQFGPNPAVLRVLRCTYGVENSVFRAGRR